MSCKKCFEEIGDKLGAMPGAFVLQPDDHTAQIRAEASAYIQKRLPWLPADKVEAAAGRVQAAYHAGTASEGDPPRSFKGEMTGVDYEMLMPNQQNGVWEASKQMLRETGERLESGDIIYAQLTIQDKPEPFFRQMYVETKDRVFGNTYTIEGMHEKTELEIRPGGRRGSLQVVELAKPPGGIVMEQPKQSISAYVINPRHGGYPVMPVPDTDIRLKNGRLIQADFMQMSDLYDDDLPRHPEMYDDDELAVIDPDFDTALDIVQKEYDEVAQKSANAFRERIESNNDGIRMRFQTAYAALRDENGHVIGLVSGLIDGDAAEICYYVDEAYRGNGLVSQALPGFMRQFANDYGVDAFYVAIEGNVDQAHSAAVAKAAGFNLPGDGNEKLADATGRKTGLVLGCDISQEWQFSLGKPTANETAVAPSAILLGNQEPYTPPAGAIELYEYRDRSFYLRSRHAEKAMDAASLKVEATELARRSPLSEANGYWWSCQALAHQSNPELQRYGLELAREGYQDNPNGLVDTLDRLYLNDTYGNKGGIDTAVRREAVNMMLEAIPQNSGYPMHSWRNLAENHADLISPDQAETIVKSVQGMHLWDAYKHLPEPLVTEAATSHVFEAVRAEYEKRSTNSHPYYGGIEHQMKLLYGRLTPEQQTAVRGWGIKLPGVS